jgi:glycosyltransferase involved in cell wall biosynthesis
MPAGCGRPVSTRDVAFVGEVGVRKGVPGLMKAWELVEREVPGVRIRLVGAGSLADEVAAWCASRPERREFLGQLSHAATMDVIASAAVLAAPSRRHGRWREQIGLPLTEALSYGLTIVTTDETGLADWLLARRHFVLPSSSDTGALAEALVRAVRAPLTRDEVRGALPSIGGRQRSQAYIHGWQFGRPESEMGVERREP